ncbi:MAG: hypothetical protein ABSB66_02700 [Candidatus Acidiferrales bacterium]
MNATVPGSCQRAGCASPIPAALSSAQLCLDHFVDEAFVRTDEALGRCREGRAMDSDGLQRLLSDALAVVNNLEEGADEPNPEQRDRMLELLLVLSNVHEYVANQSVRIKLPA